MSTKYVFKYFFFGGGGAAALLGAAFSIHSKSPFSCDLIIRRSNSNNQMQLESVVKKAQKKNEPVIARHWLLMSYDGLWYTVPFTVVQWYVPELRRNVLPTFSGLHCGRLSDIFKNRTDFDEMQ